MLKCRLLQSASFFIYLVYICIFVAAFRLNFGICRHCSKDLFAFYVALYACCMFSQKIERNCAVESANRYVVLVQSKLIKVNYAIQDSKSIIMFFNGTPGAIRTRGLSLRSLGPEHARCGPLSTLVCRNYTVFSCVRVPLCTSEIRYFH